MLVFKELSKASLYVLTMGGPGAGTNALVPRLLGTAVHELKIRFTTDAREGNCSNFLTHQLQTPFGRKGGVIRVSGCSEERAVTDGAGQVGWLSSWVTAMK